MKTQVKKRMKKRIILLLIMVGVILIGCKKIEPTILILNAEKNITLNIGDEKEVAIAVHKKFTVVWESEEPSIAKVSDGKITAVSAGSTSVKVSINDGKVEKVINVLVTYPKPESIAVIGDDKVTVGETSFLEAVITPKEAEQKVIWESSDETIATVVNGKVTAIKAGKVTIKAYADSDHEIMKTVTIKIILQEPTVLELLGKSELIIGDEEQYRVATTPVDANQQVIWSVDDDKVLSIDEAGNIKALAEGNAVITATAINSKISATKKVTVKYESPTAININGVEFLNIGEENLFIAEVIPITAKQQVIWSVSDNTIASIDGDGMVTALTGGEVLIIATSADLEAIYNEFILTVYDAPNKIDYRGPELFIIGGTGKVSGEISGVNKLLIDASKITFSVDDNSILSIDDKTGNVNALKVGGCNITITSLLNNEVKVTQAVNVINEDHIYSLAKVIICQGYDYKESFYSTYDYKTHIMGFDAFDSIKAAIPKVNDGARLVLLTGEYSDEVEINKNNITITAIGEVIYKGLIRIAKGVDGLTIENLQFTNQGRVVGDLEGGINNFTFRNNIVYDALIPGLGVLEFFVTAENNYNSNFVIENNVFKVESITTMKYSYFRGGNINNLKIVGNEFSGLKDLHNDAIKISGNFINGMESTASGSGATGEVRITNNVFRNFGQRAILIARYSANEVLIADNTFDSVGSNEIGGGIQLQNWTGSNETMVRILYNTFKNIDGLFGVRINNKNANESLYQLVNYNKFVDFNSKTSKFIQGYNDAFLIDGAHNYFNIFTEDKVINVEGTDQFFTNEDEYQLAVKLAKADPIYGVAAFNDDFETHDNIAYTDYATTIGGLDWKIKEVYLNPDNNDLASATETQGEKMIRLRGSKTAYLELSEFFKGITTLAFDAKYYSSANASAKLKVSKMVDGQWVEVETVTLTENYQTFYVLINEAGNVKVKIDVTSKSANIDNLRFYQSEELVKELNN